VRKQMKTSTGVDSVQLVSAMPANVPAQRWQQASVQARAPTLSLLTESSTERAALTRSTSRSRQSSRCRVSTQSCADLSASLKPAKTPWNRTESLRAVDNNVYDHRSDLAAVVIQRFARGYWARVRLRKQSASNFAAPARLRKQAATAAKISRTLPRAWAAKKKSRMQRSSTSSMLQPVEGRAESSPTPKRGRVTVVRRRSTRSQTHVTMEEDAPAATLAMDSTTSSATLKDDATRFAAPVRTLSHADRTDHILRSFLEVARQAKQKQEASHCATTNTESAKQPGEKRPALTRTSSSSFGLGF